MKVLVTGGAGFIGSHLVDALISSGHEVRVLDCLDMQVHKTNKLPGYLNASAEFVRGDVKDTEVMRNAIKDIEVVFHEASAVGVGQSMYKIKHYVDVNSGGTANLLDVLVNEEHSVSKLVVAASMSSYGEGAYSCERCGTVYPPLRPEEQLKRKEWEPKCPHCNTTLKSIPTPETKPLDSNSIYSISKKNQEEMVLIVGKTYGIPAVSLRYFNVYGPRQSLSNPYTGVAAIFMSRIKNNRQPIIFEDGLQSRDFVHVSDIVQANLVAMNNSSANYKAFNVGSGHPVSIQKVAEIIAELFKSNVKPKITNEYRKGDVRHCFADIDKIKAIGFKPKVDFYSGMKELVEWAHGENAVDNLDAALMELKEKHLV